MQLSFVLIKSITFLKQLCTILAIFKNSSIAIQSLYILLQNH